MQEGYQMRRLIAISMLIALAAAGAHAEVAWETGSWDDILTKAAKEDRFVFVDFYAVWCGPCKRLDKITYQDEAVGEFMNTMLNVKYDAEKDFGEELADKYKVAVYPTLILFGPDGKEVDRAVGYLAPEEFIETIQGYTRGIGTIAALRKQLDQDPENVDLLVELGVKYADAVLPDDSKEMFDRAIALDPDGEKVNRARVLYELGYSYYSAERYPEAKPYFEKIISDYKDTDYYGAGIGGLARTDHKLGNDEAAVAGYYTLVEAEPDDPGTLNGFAWFCSQRGIGLDQALPVALKAVELSDRDPGILDTLAEVYFARGDYENALKIGKEALASDPDDTYFQDQVEKYETALKKAGSEASMR
jgi:tetratricopeptide (TPR) repeat protein